MVSSQPLVSIGLPVYNGAKYLEEALDSVLAQSLTNFEVIICDNGSTDETQTICNRYQASDQRIKYFRNAENLGAAKNFNRTFELSKGKYFKWFAHDDRLDPTYLSRCVDALEQAPESVVLCFPCVQYIDQEGNLIGNERSLGIKQAHKNESYHKISFRRLLKLSPACYPMLVFGLVRKTALSKTGLIGPYVMSDLTVVAELRLLGEFIEIPDRLFFQRIYQREPTRMMRNKVRGEAVWYSPANQNRRFLFPNVKLVLEYCRAIRRLGPGGSYNMMAYLAVSGFITATIKRSFTSRMWALWSILSVALLRFSAITSIPIRLWCFLAALRHQDKNKLHVAFVKPWYKTPFEIFLFGAERLTRRHDHHACNVLLDWLTSSNPAQQSAAAEAIAHASEQYRQLLKGYSAEAIPELNIIVETAIQSHMENSDSQCLSHR